MEQAVPTLSPLAALVAWSAVLLFVHIVLQAMLSTRELGSAWNAGPRDGDRRPVGILAGRAERAAANFRETYPAFVGLALTLVIVGDRSGWGLAGALVWFVGRIVYLPLYLAGVPYVRSLVWTLAAAGLLMMVAALVF
ncbi:MAPEG family protein [Sinorhizobium sp. BG8]|uniref:MAPEG family protein n=1 Tax=Sinorhizobium sp. BG8 TaxID=2613773 RepID=UPI00193EA8C6|nr:MAPEG family protein [Sinorhizobium sp. BG8]QRM53434.1 hypothetical protein F3Y30_01805 [Sinorhizobium sp. BG8]